MSDSSKALFLSYASQDADAARRICDALRAAGVEVWFDQSELRGGDAWDAKIRKQIGACDLFIAVISANTQARLEGYFRIEWKLAAQRTHAMADEKAFLLPVVIDDTRDAEARVPTEFKAVQWTRLPDGEAPAAFCARVKHLLGGSSDTSVPPGLEELNHGRHARATTEPRHRGRRWLLPAIIGVVACAAIGIWQLWKVRSLPAPANATSAASLSAARQLTLKARALIDDDLMAVRENFRLADELCQQAVGLDSTDGEAWATWARVSAAMIQKQYDRTRQRTEAARRQAERAIRLAPDSIEAGLAMAAYSAVTNETGEAERRLRALLNQAPKDARVALALAQALDALGRATEASDLRLKHPAFAQNDARPLLQEAAALLRQGRFVDAQAWVDRVHAHAPTWASYRAKLQLAGVIWGDLEAAKQILDQAPPGFLREGGPALSAAQVWLWRREPEKALEVLRRIAGDFFEEDNSMRPKGFYSGWAHQIAGRPTAAQAEWRQALAAVGRRLTNEPNEEALLNHQALLLALTGQKEEAEKIHRLRVEMGNDRFGLGGLGVSSMESQRQARTMLDARYTAAFFLALDNREDAIRVLQGTEIPHGATRALHLNNLRYDPWFEPIRKDSRIQKIIAENEAWLNELRRAGANPADAKSASAGGPVRDAKSIAVLAFRQLSADPENEYLCEAIPDELCNALGKLPGLKVAATASAFSFKGNKRERPAEMARQLGVAYLVDGSVQKIGNRVRVRAELIKAIDESPVWKSDLPDYELKDMFALQDAVVGAIAKSLQVQLGGAPAPVQAVNPEAYRLYYEGRQAWSMRGTPEKVPRAKELFEKALALDPNLGRAYAGLVDALSELSLTATPAGGEFTSHFGQRASARQAEMLALASKGVQLEPNSAETHEALGRVSWYTWQTAASEQELRIALRLNPNYADAHLILARLLHGEGRVDEALASVRKATELDPLTSRHFDNFSLILRDAGRYREALVQAERALGLQPNSLQGRRFRMNAFTSLGRHDEAVAIARQPDVSAYAGITFAHAGLVNEALKSIEWSGNSNTSRAVVLATLGRTEEAMNVLTPGDTTALGLHYLLYQSELDPLRRDPRFVAYLEALGVKDAHDRAQAWRAAHPPEKPVAKE